MSVIGNLEAAIVERIGLALTLPNQQHPKVEVRGWPEKPRDYKLTHPHGCAMVIYKGSKYGYGKSNSGQVVNETTEFEIGLISRTLREPNAPAQDAMQGLGIYDLLEDCRNTLSGWQPDIASSPIQLVASAYGGHVEGTWSYSLRIAIPITAIAGRPCPPGPWVQECCDTTTLTTEVAYIEQLMKEQQP